MGTTDTFIRNFGDAGGTASLTDAGVFGETLTELVEPPSVGAPLATLGVSLETANVSIDPTPAALKRATRGSRR